VAVRRFDHRTIRKTLAGFRRGIAGAVALRRFNAFMTAIRASFSGPSRSATSNNVSIATSAMTSSQRLSPSDVDFSSPSLFRNRNGFSSDIGPNTF
jgi:hypothetical protein